MTYLIGHSQVEDFDTWHSTFRNNESFRAEHGERGYQVFQSIDDPNDVTIVFDWAENEDPRAFFESDEMREIMAEAGLKGRPELTAVELVDQKTARKSSA